MQTTYYAALNMMYLGLWGMRTGKGRRKNGFWLNRIVEYFSSLEECFSSTHIHNNLGYSVCRFPDSIANNSDSEFSGIWSRNLHFLISIPVHFNGGSYLTPNLINSCYEGLLYNCVFPQPHWAVIVKTPSRVLNRHILEIHKLNTHTKKHKTSLDKCLWYHYT